MSWTDFIRNRLATRTDFVLPHDIAPTPDTDPIEISVPAFDPAGDAQTYRPWRIADFFRAALSGAWAGASGSVAATSRVIVDGEDASTWAVIGSLDLGSSGGPKIIAATTIPVSCVGDMTTISLRYRLLGTTLGNGVESETGIAASAVSGTSGSGTNIVFPEMAINLPEGVPAQLVVEWRGTDDTGLGAVDKTLYTAGFDLEVTAGAPEVAAHTHPTSDIDGLDATLDDHEDRITLLEASDPIHPVPLATGSTTDPGFVFAADGSPVLTMVNFDE